MIVCESLKCVFVHVQKTGGSTITEILAPYADPGIGTGERFGWQIPFHTGKMHCGITAGYSDYFKFAFVRNPYDRIQSWWRDRGKGFAKARPLPTMCSLTGGLDYIGRYENYEQEVRRICDLLGIAIGAVPHRLSTKDRVQPMSEAEAAEVLRRYREDFDRFGYEEDSWRAT